MDGLSRARECECGRVTLGISQWCCTRFLDMSSDDSSGVLSAKRRAVCMTRACHSIFKGYLTYTTLT
jgi:hypothetical protein